MNAPLTTLEICKRIESAHQQLLEVLAEATARNGMEGELYRAVVCACVHVAQAKGCIAFPVRGEELIELRPTQWGADS